eukprot:TRINITY_DN124178_c0_g1_i1.p1 TRINITY_DN124178_c0_g1~~TRINITY_DN124178_c0_g1_i1.p1  ORF type:complete len:206 (+),score=46.24 TRINITY_DN124178_c0_g1_i1:83-619(+)
MARWGLSLYGREDGFLDSILPYVFFGQEAIPSNLNTSQVQSASDQLFRVADSNKDLMVTFGELEAIFARQLLRVGEGVTDEALQLDRERFKWQAEDTLLFHDRDMSGHVSLVEFEWSVQRFLAVQRRLQNIKSFAKPAELLHQEREWIREFLCMGKETNCKHITQLIQDYGPQEHHEL